MRQEGNRKEARIVSMAGLATLAETNPAAMLQSIPRVQPVSNLSSSRDLEWQPNGRRHGRSTLFMHDSNKAGCRNTASCTSPLLHGQESPAFFSAGPDPGNLYRLYIDKCMQCRASKVHAVAVCQSPGACALPAFAPSS